MPDQDGEFSSLLQEDDGRTRAHERGAFLRTSFTLARKGSELSIRAKVTGQGYPEHRRQGFILVLHGTEREVDLNGQRRTLSNGRLAFDNTGEPFDLTAELG